jgi:hypothetical protein
MEAASEASLECQSLLSTFSIMYCWAVYNRSEQKDSSHHILAHTQNLRRHMLI